MDIQIVDEDGVVEDKFSTEDEAMDRYYELIEEEFAFKGVVKIIMVLKEIY